MKKFNSQPKENFVSGEMDVSLYEKGSKVSFKCQCGCNVFRRITNAMIPAYRCKSCLRLYGTE